MPPVVAAACCPRIAAPRVTAAPTHDRARQGRTHHHSVSPGFCTAGPTARCGRQWGFLREKTADTRPSARTRYGSAHPARTPKTACRWACGRTARARVVGRRDCMPLPKAGRNRNRHLVLGNSTLDIKTLFEEMGPGRRRAKREAVPFACRQRPRHDRSGVRACTSLGYRNRDLSAADRGKTSPDR